MNHLPAACATLAAILGLSLSPARAAAVSDDDFHFENTEDLYAVCSVPAESPESVPAGFACRAFIEATVQYHDAVSDREAMERMICYPKTATVGDGQAVFVAWAESNADDQTLMGETPVVGVVRALAEEYPCAIPAAENGGVPGSGSSRTSASPAEQASAP